MRFNSLDDIRAFCRDLPGGDAKAAEAAVLRQQNLTKPPGSLGRLEELAIWLARWQASEMPRLDRVTIAVFRRQSRRRRPRRFGVSARSHRADGGEFRGRRVRRSTRSRRSPAPNCAWCRSNSTRPTRDFTVAAAMDTEEFLDAVDAGFQRGGRRLRSAGRRRNGNCQYHDGSDAVRRAARRRRRPAGPAAAPASTMTG